MSEELKKFRGKMQRLVYESIDNYRIYGMDVDMNIYPDLHQNKYGNICITGIIYPLDPNVMYEIVAREKEGKYGTQYDVYHIRREMPHTDQEIFSFLTSVLTNNQAENIYQVYPDIIDRVLNNLPVDLNLIKGVKEKSFQKIKEKIITNFALMDVIAKFNDLLSMTVIEKLYQEYTSVDMIIKKISEDPYGCLCNLSGVGFLKADEIVDKMLTTMKRDPNCEFTIDKDIKSSLYRCVFCIIYLLQKNEESGHTYIGLQELRNGLIAHAPECKNQFVYALQDSRIHLDRDKLTISLTSTYDEESFIANTIVEACYNPIDWYCDINDLTNYCEINGIKLTKEQMKALAMFVRHSVMLLNGTAGTGKSQTITAIINMLDNIGKTYMLMTPTGKAAKVLREYTGKNATTIHRGLAYRPGIGWGYNENNKLICDVVIVDEFSMVDIHLCKHLFDAINFSTTKLLMVGDDAQLPSVSAGNLLHDFLESSVINHVSLTHVFRYGEGGLMTVATDVRNSKSYLRNITKQVTPFGNGDYVFVADEDERLVNKVVALYKGLLDHGCNISDIEVLSSQKVGDYGSRAINKAIQSVVNPFCRNGVNGLAHGSITFYEDDPVIQTINNYKAHNIRTDTEEFIANGEIGIIRSIDEDNVYIDFDTITVCYTHEQMSTVDLAYCITVHKSQGSSAKNVIFISPKAHTFMLNSNIIYVALTRTKEHCYHFGNIKTINSSVHKKENYLRNTLMQDFIFDASIKMNQELMHTLRDLPVTIIDTEKIKNN